MNTSIPAAAALLLAACCLAGCGRDDPIATQAALIDQYCTDCHNQAEAAGNLSLESRKLGEVAHDAEVWEKVVRKLRAGVMPPQGEARPEKASYDGLAVWLEEELDRAAAAAPNPGSKPPFHRLNRAEYENAIRDLLAVEVDVVDLLPPDDASYGFDNIAGVLRINSTIMERYLSAARRIGRLAMGSPDTPPTAHTFRLRPDHPQGGRVAELPFGTRGGMLIRHTFPVDADYVINLELGGGRASAPRQLEVNIDGELVKQFDIVPRGQRAAPAPEPESAAPNVVETADADADSNAVADAGANANADADADDEYAPEADDDRLAIRLPIQAGPREIAVMFIKETGSIALEGPRAFFSRPGPFHEGNRIMPVPEPSLASVTITGPFEISGAGDTPSRREILVCTPETQADELPCARTILTRLAARALRRPVTDEDVQPLVDFFAANREQGFESGIELSLRRLLVHPEFLFRIEAVPQDVAPGENYRLSDLELASRLSFFLWSSIPDDELVELATSGELGTPEVLRAQVRRLLADPRADAFVENFAGQWLLLRNLDAIDPASFLFPNFEDSLRQSMRRETELFFGSILREDRSAIELLTADYTFVNERLARHYGIPGVYGSRFRRVTIPDPNRRGLLGHGSILLATSRPNRTSPVLRGKWILQNILGVNPPDPPPDIPALQEKSDVTDQVDSVRARLARHREDPACFVCHAMIDPAGFALEHFDAVGRWRDLDESFEPIDASGTFPDGTTFNGVAELRDVLINPPTQFVTTLTEKLFTYALGRGVEYYDAPAVREVVRGAAEDDYRLSSLVIEIVESVPFQMNRKTGETL